MFLGEGDESPNVIAGDVKFLCKLSDEPHPYLKLESLDIVFVGTPLGHQEALHMETVWHLVSSEAALPC